MRIAVGSQNPVKVNAVRNVIGKIWPGAHIVSVAASSGIASQPQSSEEALTGATNRAQHALEQTKADLGIGLEGYVYDSRHGMFLSGWVVAIDKYGVRGMGSGYTLLLPERIAEELRNGRELGPIMDRVVGEDNTKQKDGAIGALTAHKMTRTTAFEASVIYALTPFLRPELYAH